jgi:hypothetical protein
MKNLSHSALGRVLSALCCLVGWTIASDRALGGNPALAEEILAYRHALDKAEPAVKGYAGGRLAEARFVFYTYEDIVQKFSGLDLPDPGKAIRQNWWDGYQRAVNQAAANASNSIQSAQEALNVYQRVLMRSRKMPDAELTRARQEAIERIKAAAARIQTLTSPMHTHFEDSLMEGMGTMSHEVNKPLFARARHWGEPYPKERYLKGLVQDLAPGLAQAESKAVSLGNGYKAGDKVRLLGAVQDCRPFSEGDVNDVDTENHALTVTIKINPPPGCTPFVRLLAGYATNLFDHNVRCP